MIYLEPGYSLCKDLFLPVHLSPRLQSFANGKGSDSPRNLPTTWRAMDSNSHLPNLSSCQLCCSAFQMFFLESAVAPCPKWPQTPGPPLWASELIIFHYLVSSLLTLYMSYILCIFPSCPQVIQIICISVMEVEYKSYLKNKMYCRF